LRSYSKMETYESVFPFFLIINNKSIILNFMNNKKRGSIILTSTGISTDSVRQLTIKYFSTLPLKSVAIVTTAAEGKENNKYSKLAETQFKELGFSVVNFVDIENNPHADFSKYNVIYVCGGNTFKLLKYAREAHFKETLEELLGREGVYIGVSAGSIILAPTIQIAVSVDPEPNEIGISDLTGLNLISFEVHPHYESTQDIELSLYQKITKNKIIRISNSQALIISDSGQEVVG
jgi:dipeptidase E